jgi:hypothetical protein
MVAGSKCAFQYRPPQPFGPLIEAQIVSAFGKILTHSRRHVPGTTERDRLEETAASMPLSDSYAAMNSGVQGVPRSLTNNDTSLAKIGSNFLRSRTKPRPYLNRETSEPSAGAACGRPELPLMRTPLLNA